jgi:hypothetical protein
LKALFKSTIVIWTEYDPTQLELTDLAHEAESGDAYCSKTDCILMAEPEKDPTWDGTDFFDAEINEDRDPRSATLNNHTPETEPSVDRENLYRVPNYHQALNA